MRENDVQTRILVVGASGYIGRSIAWQAHMAGTLVGATYATAELAIDFPWLRYRYEDDSAGNILAISEPTVIIIASAVRADNDRGISLLIKSIRRWSDNVRLIFVSTDAVFDGAKGYYVETDPPHPCTDHGRRMLTAECSLLDVLDDCLVVRTSYVCGYSLGILDRRWRWLLSNIAMGRHVNYSPRIFKSPIDVNTLAALVLGAANSSMSGILHAVGTRMSVYDFYRRGLEFLSLGSSSRLLVEQQDTSPSDTSLATIRGDERIEFLIPPS